MAAAGDAESAQADLIALLTAEFPRVDPVAVAAVVRSSGSDFEVSYNTLLAMHRGMRKSGKAKKKNKKKEKVAADGDEGSADGRKEAGHKKKKKKKKKKSKSKHKGGDAGDSALLRPDPVGGSAVIARLVEDFPNVDSSIITDIVLNMNGDYSASRQAVAAVRDPNYEKRRWKPGQRITWKKKAKKRRADGRKLTKEEQKRQAKKEQHKRLKAVYKEKMRQGVSPEEWAEELRGEMVQNLVSLANAGDINVINEPREGANLLVLDMDYTLFDMKTSFSTEKELLELKRPFLDEFLRGVHPHYDIAIWSQTSWQRLERIMTALGALTSDEWNITFVVDHTAMYTVTRIVNGKPIQHAVKDLHYIWGKFPDYYNPCNTIHVDDLDRNFACNPENGLVVPAFDAPLRLSETDQTLKLLRRYLLLIKDHADFTSLDHGEWEVYLAQHESAEAAGTTVPAEAGEGGGSGGGESESSSSWGMSGSDPHPSGRPQPRVTTPANGTEGHSDVRATASLEGRGSPHNSSFRNRAHFRRAGGRQVIEGSRGGSRTSGREPAAAAAAVAASASSSSSSWEFVDDPVRVGTASQLSFGAGSSGVNAADAAVAGASEGAVEAGGRAGSTSSSSSSFYT